MNEGTKEVVFILMILIGATSAAQKTLPEDGTLGELAWKSLLSSRQTRPDQQHDSPLPTRRITTKSLFIAPQIGLESVPDCPNGHRVSTKGECIKVINLDQTAHLEFLLQKLNSQFATEEVKEGSYDYDIEELPENAGPFQLNIPLPLQMNGPRPEDTEGSVNAFVLSKKEVRNPSEDITDTENKNGISYPETIPDGNIKNQFFLGELSPIPQESSVANHSEPEVPIHVKDIDGDKNMTILDSLEAIEIVTNKSDELALESELEILQLHKIGEQLNTSFLNNKNINTTLNNNDSTAIIKDTESLYMTNLHLINTVNNITHINNTDKINHFESLKNLQSNEEVKKSETDEISKIPPENNDKIINMDNDTKIIYKESGEKPIIINEFIQKMVIIQPEKVENDDENLQNIENLEILDSDSSSDSKTFTEIHIKQNISAPNVTKTVDFINNSNKSISNDIPKVTPPNVSLLDLIVGDVDLKLDSKIKKISRIANVKTNDDKNIPQINEDKRSDIEPNSDSVPEESAPVVSDYVQTKKQTQQTPEPMNDDVKSRIHNNFLDQDALNRQPYWWLPPEWEVRPSKDRSQLMNFWSRLPLVTDPSFNYPYLRRPQRHYMPYQHSLYPHQPFQKLPANFERPIFNYRMARHYPRSYGAPFYWQTNLQQWDNTRERIQR